jgi:hypothetical protein
MKISDILKLIFAGTRAEPSPPAKLDSTTEAALAQSVGRLSLGEPGWITMQEGRRLFSPMADLYAFGEMDEVGRNNLTRFGTQNDVRQRMRPGLVASLARRTFREIREVP